MTTIDGMSTFDQLLPIKYFSVCFLKKKYQKLVFGLYRK